MGLEAQVFQKSPFDGLLLKNRYYGNSKTLPVTLLCLHAIPMQKIAKNTGKEVKTTMQKLWLNSFGNQSFVLH